MGEINENKINSIKDERNSSKNVVDDDGFGCFVFVFLILLLSCTVFAVIYGIWVIYNDCSPLLNANRIEQLDYLHNIGDTVELDTTREPVTIIGYYKEYPKDNLPFKGEYDYIGVSYIEGYKGKDNVYCFTEDNIENTYQTDEENPIGKLVKLNYRKEPIVIIGYCENSYLSGRRTESDFYSKNDKRHLDDQIHDQPSLFDYDYIGVSYYNGYLGNRYVYCFYEDDIEGPYDLLSIDTSITESTTKEITESIDYKTDIHE